MSRQANESKGYMLLILKHIAIEGPGTIGEYFQKKGYPCRIIELENGEKVPTDLNDVTGVIILGGPMNVYEEDKYPFLAEENQFITKVLEKEIPFLGICLGSQLLAKACGAKVLKASIKEIGWRMIEQTHDGQRDPLFTGLLEQLIVFQWHEDTFELPWEAQLLSTSTVVKNQAFRFGKYAYGLQYHVEVTKEIIESWIKEYFKIEDINRSVEGKKMMDQYQQLGKQFQSQSQVIYKNFERIIKDRRKQSVNA